MCDDIVVKNDLPLRDSRRNDAHPRLPFFHVLLLGVPGIMEVNGSNFDVLEKGVLVEQNCTRSIICHMETIRQELAVKIFNCLQGDVLPLTCNVFFDGSFFSASRSWVPVANAEPFLFSQAVGTSASKRYSSLDEECFLARWSGDPTSEIPSRMDEGVFLVAR